MRTSNPNILPRRSKLDRVEISSKRIENKRNRHYNGFDPNCKAISFNAPMDAEETSQTLRDAVQRI